MSVVRRYWLLIAVAIIVILAIALLRRPSSQPATVAPAVQIATAREGDLPVSVTAHGRAGPPPGTSASLAFQVAGRIADISVRVGDRVDTGQTLAHLDSEPFVLAVAQARGDADAATGTLQSTTSSAAVRIAEAAALTHQADLKVQADTSALQRERTLYSAGIAAAKDVQSAQNQLAGDEADARTAHVREQALRSGIGSQAPDRGQAQADVLAARGQAERARAALAEAQRQLDNTTLRAPGPGIVVAILKHPGESVDPTVPVVTLGAPMERTATLSVPAEIARRIRVGDSASLRVARSDNVYPGKVVAAVPAVDPATQQATVVVSGLPASAVAGDAVEARIVLMTASGVLVPTSAIVQDPQSGDSLVFVATTDPRGQQRFEPRKVSVGPGDQSTTQIKSGLHAGERVASEGAFELLAPANTGD